MKSRYLTLEAPTSALEVAQLRRPVAGRPELAASSLRLVVAVRVAVLVHAQDLVGPVDPADELPREHGSQEGRDHGEVERQSALLEQVEQREQTVVAPARVVVAEEDRHRPRRDV